jgi:oligosaccharide repeat unit polymerase
VIYAKAMGLTEARSITDLILLPGIARVEVFSGQRMIPMYSRVCVLFAYPGVVLALAYYYLYRWRWWLIIPMICVLLYGVTESGRAGTMIVIVQIALSVYLKSVLVLKQKASKILLQSVVLPGAMILTVFIGGQFLREGFNATGIEDVSRVMSSDRAYLFGGVSAFSYWIDRIYEPGTMTLGRYSFSSLYSALGLAKQEVGIYDFYAPVSPAGEVTNVYTAYRSFIEDFTVPGASAFYLIAGIFCGYAMNRVVKKEDGLILVLIPMLSWLALSPLFSATYFNSFLLSCVLPLFVWRRIAKNKHEHHKICIS